MRNASNDYYKALFDSRLYSSLDVKFLLGIKSDTTLIKLERKGIIKVKARIGNQKRYCPNHIKKLIDRGVR